MDQAAKARAELAALLRARVKETARTQRQLALDLSIGNSALSLMLGGKGGFPSLRRLEPLAGRLGCLAEALEIRREYLLERRRRRYRSPGFEGGDGI